MTYPNLRFVTLYIYTDAIFIHLPQTNRCTSKPPSAQSIKYKSPAELGMRPIKFRPEVFEREGCRRDITYLIDRATGDMVRSFQKKFNHNSLCFQVGGCRFEGIPLGSHDSIIEHHAHTVSSAPSVHRGAAFETWKHGAMVPIGARMAQGGRPGDAFGSYAYMHSETSDQIDTMFNYAEVLFYDIYSYIYMD